MITFKEWWSKETYFGGEGCMEASELAWDYKDDQMKEKDERIRALEKKLERTFIYIEALKEQIKYGVKRDKDYIKRLERVISEEETCIPSRLMVNPLVKNTLK